MEEDDSAAVDARSIYIGNVGHPELQVILNLLTRFDILVGAMG